MMILILMYSLILLLISLQWHRRPTDYLANGAKANNTGRPTTKPSPTAKARAMATGECTRNRNRHKRTNTDRRKSTNSLTHTRDTPAAVRRTARAHARPIPGHQHAPNVSVDEEGQEEESVYDNEALQALADFTDWDERGVFMRLVLLVEFPFIVALRATCPLIEEETWSRHWNALTVIFAPQLMLYVFGAWTQTFSIVVGVLGVIFAAGFFWYIAPTDNSLPRDEIRVLFVLLAFVMSCVWTYLIANELVGVFTVLGALFDISDGIMGVTVLAWGNSLGDLFGDVALANKGEPRMVSLCMYMLRVYSCCARVPVLRVVKRDPARFILLYHATPTSLHSSRPVLLS